MCFHTNPSVLRHAGAQWGHQHPSVSILPPPRGAQARSCASQARATAVREMVTTKLYGSMDMEALGPSQLAGSPVQRLSSSSSSFSAGPTPPLQQAVVEVHFQIQYGCEFGQHVSIIGSPQGWHVPAAVPMTWSQGDVWNAVVPVQVETEIEYKYIVVWEDGCIARWQEGPNNRLSAQHPGTLLHVEDTWGQRERSVREVGLRLTHNPKYAQAGGHSSATATAAASAAAAAPVAPPTASVTRQQAVQHAAVGAAAQRSTHNMTLQQPSGVTELPGPAVSRPQPATAMPTQPTWNRVFDQPSLLEQLNTAAVYDDEQLPYEDEEEDQHWPADMLQKAAAAAPSVQHVPAAPKNKVAAYAEGTGATAQDLAPAAFRSSLSSSQHKLQVLQGQGDAPRDYLAELLPLLRAELQAALTELSKHPEAATEQASLLSEGHAVLQALQQHELSDPAGSNSSSSVNGHAAATSANGRSSSSNKSQGRSPVSTLSSGDEIAAALLSDDCEDACFCMVDAICSCADWDLSCSCEEDPDAACVITDDSPTAAVQDSSEQVARTRSMDAAPGTGGLAAPAAAAAAPAPAPVPAPAPAAAAQAPAPADIPGVVAFPGAAASAVSGSSAVSVSELARAAAAAARYDPAALAARAAAFTDVQSALAKSAQLLQALSDPCHPLVLEADRQLATASRQLHSGRLLH